MKIEKFVTGIISTNCYIVTNEETKETVIVDPANLSKAMIGYIEEEELVIKAILLTHAHFDHIMGIDKVIDRYGEMPVYVEESDLELLHTPSMNESTVYTNGYSYPGGDVIHDGDVLHLIGEDFRVIHTPGHTQGGVCYYVEKEGVLFSGEIGPHFEHFEKFPERINTEFIEVLDKHTLKMRVWERGSGETMACGTGACASAVAACLNGYCRKGEDITVKLRGGDLIINYTDDGVQMTGSADTVFTGIVEI